MKVEEGVPLARFTTIGTGGPARAFAQPSTLEELEEALAWSRERGLSVATIGLGSNLLVADEGVEAVVLRLGGDLAAAETQNDLLVAGGGAANAVCLHRVRAAGLGGFEFACRGEISAPPIRWPFSPQASSIRPAVSSWSGFLKTLPYVRLFVGCASLRWRCRSETIALISATGRGSRRNSTRATTWPWRSSDRR